MKHYCILISPSGEEFYSSYGPLTKDRSKATQYVSSDIANRAASQRFGTDGRAFWNSERQATENARKRYRGWTHRVEPCEMVTA